MKLTNLSHAPKYMGSHEIPANGTADVPASVAARCAKMDEFRCDDPEAADHFAIKKNGRLHLGWASPIMYLDGYGSIGQEIAAEFCRMGVATYIVPKDYTPTTAKMAEGRAEWVEKGHVPAEIVQALDNPPDYPLYGFNLTWPRAVQLSPWPRTMGYTMFETTRPPREWVAPMNQTRRIIVPCKQNREAFQGIGVTAPISVVPLGVNPDLWPFHDRMRRDQPYTFLMAAGITYRKGPDLALRAFVDAFPDQRDVRLVLKTRAGDNFKLFGREVPNDDRIELVAEDSTPERMAWWMHQADAFVFPSRGEGFGLTPLQSMSTGLPTIVSDNTGMSEYADKAYNYPIPCRQVKVPSQPHPAAFPAIWGDVGDWFEPSHDALVAAYRHLYAHRVEGIAKGRRAAEWVRRFWTVRRTCEQLIDVVRKDAAGDGLGW